MIVRKLGDGTAMLIGQSDHSRLSGILAAHWGNDRFERPRPFESALRAATLHDAGWYRYETKPLYDAETRFSPSFMQVPLDDVQLGAFQWATDWLTDIDPYAGMLINRHRSGLWRGRYGSVDYPVVYNAKNLSDKVEAFIARAEADHEERLKSVDPHEFEVNYRLLQAWDFLSLYFCAKEPVPDHIEFVPQSYKDRGKEGVRLTLTPQSETHVRIDPYPFDVDPLPIQYVYRHLPRDSYDSEEDFRKAYYQANPELKHYVFVK
ncbi:DUF3891 family protein [Pelagibacterium lacus]|nr:DUF3891 family protein [Pelagibacterium lacus]